MATVQKPFYTPEQYLERERAAEFRSEYISGEVFAMAGASREHNLISLNIGRRLSEQPCEAYVSYMRVQFNVTGPYFYPDVVVVCEEPRFSDGHGDSLLNPTVIIEVLSPSTEAYDRGEKFIHYRRMASLQEYVLVAQNTPRIERFVRQGDFWILAESSGLEASLTLETIGCALELSSVYRKVTFPSVGEQSMGDS
jgi:Uma2 family endonuclease